MKFVENIIADNQYFKETMPKNQIVLHHTAGGGNAKNVIHGWNFNPERIGTAFVIDSEGIIFKAFEPQYWAWHLGLKTNSNSKLNKHSIGIEVCNWGQLIERDGKYYNYINKEVHAEQVVQMPEFRGFKYYHAYNNKQLSAVKELVLYLAEQFKIDLTYNNDMWDISTAALGGKPGLWTHVSYRKDKNDMSPQTLLIDTLTNLNK